jgi:hypothetical protein
LLRRTCVLSNRKTKTSFAVDEAPEESFWQEINMLHKAMTAIA